MDFIVLAVVFVIIAAAAGYVIRAKKRGVKCVGCPSGGTCSAQCSGCSCGCGSAE